MKPFVPMSPILVEDDLPNGSEWIYQLKWDGFRVLASVQDGKVQLYSKQMAPKSRIYPEIVEALEDKPGTFILDGEAVVLDPNSGKPRFQRMQQRDKLTNGTAIRKARSTHPIHYIMFDLLYLNGTDLRSMPWEERNHLLLELTKGWGSPLYTAETFYDGEILWDWVKEQQFEGVIAKRKNSLYLEGKEHTDWLKRKTIHRAEVEIVGILIKEGRVSSLAMRKDGRYYGRVSSGLTDKIKLRLSDLRADASQEKYFSKLPEGLRSAEIFWLAEPLTAVVTGREVTESGVLRQPKLQSIEGVTL